MKSTVISTYCEEGNTLEKPNPEIVYSILRRRAKTGRPMSYTDLSDAYYEKTGVSFEPHGTWDDNLGLINRRLFSTIGAPPITALVVKKTSNETQMPGSRFWGCSDNVPNLRSKDERLEKWLEFYDQIKAYKWPKVLP